MGSGKGVFYDLITQNPPATPQDLRAKRVELMRAIEKIRGRPLLSYATNTNIGDRRVPAMITREDIIPLSELIDSIDGPAVDFLIETPGGLAEATIEIVNLLRPRFSEVAFIIPHIAMSAGTILVMSGDEILMDHRSSLGPIDPQFMDADGRSQPAQAMLTGIATIKEEAEKNGGRLNPAYVPILRNVDPGRLQSAQNASELSRRLVTDWLVRYKFRRWEKRSSTGEAVTDELRKERASSVASCLCDHQRWLSHGRPVKIADLREMKIEITDYSKTPELQRLIWGLWVNISHLFSGTNIYKMYETSEIDLMKVAVQQPPVAPGTDGGSHKAVFDVACHQCGKIHKIQANLGAPQPLDPGAEPFPKNCMLTCKGCGIVHDLSGLKLRLESQTKKPIIL